MAIRGEEGERNRAERDGDRNKDKNDNYLGWQRGDHSMRKHGELGRRN